MGADLIGYLVKGPIPSKVDFSDHKRETFLRNLREMQSWARRVINEEDVEIPRKFLDMGLPSDPYDLEDFVEIDGGSLWDNMKDLWEDGSRDCQSRVDPGDPRQMIMFCGMMTWGDEPDGFGYQTLKLADGTGLLKLLRIR